MALLALNITDDDLIKMNVKTTLNNIKTAAAEIETALDDNKINQDAFNIRAGLGRYLAGAEKLILWAKKESIK